MKLAVDTLTPGVSIHSGRRDLPQGVIGNRPVLLISDVPRLWRIKRECSKSVVIRVVNLRISSGISARHLSIDLSLGVVDVSRSARSHFAFLWREEGPEDFSYFSPCACSSACFSPPLYNSVDSPGRADVILYWTHLPRLSCFSCLSTGPVTSLKGPLCS